MKRKGFTLLEMAIVLVVIGLLIALVMRGVVLQRGAKVKRTAADIRNIHTACMIYYERKGLYPGDADGNGLIENSTMAWDSLAYYNIAYHKNSPYGTEYILNNYYGKNVIRVVVPDGNDRLEIDRILDNGNLTSGALFLIAPDTLCYILD